MNARTAAAVTIHLPDRRIPAELSTDRAESSHGQPVLVVQGGKSFEGREVAHGIGDVTSYGLAACLLLDVEPGEGEKLLETWQEASVAFLRRHEGPWMAHEWTDAGGWTDGSTWTQPGEDGEPRKLADELDRAPLNRETLFHYDEGDEWDPVEGAGWIFPDGSGLVEVGPAWDLFDPEGRTGGGVALSREDVDEVALLASEVARVAGQEPIVTPVARTRALLEVDRWTATVKIHKALEALRHVDDGLRAQEVQDVLQEAGAAVRTGEATENEGTR